MRRADFEQLVDVEQLRLGVNLLPERHREATQERLVAALARAGR